MFFLICLFGFVYLIAPRVDETKTITGLTSTQFDAFYESVRAELKLKYRDDKNAKNALQIYLMKMRTGQSNCEIAAFFGLSTATIDKRIFAVRNILFSSFVPSHLYNRPRQYLIEHTSNISQILYARGKEDTVVLIWDGTYIYTVKSENYAFQKSTYSGQKHRNLLKMMMCVLPDGKIANVFGPYKATENDATIMDKILTEHPEAFQQLRNNDVMVVDRGFRDSVENLKKAGYMVQIPEFVKDKKKNSQLSTREANESRLVTKTRFMVENRNGHIKIVFKYFAKVLPTASLLHLGQDFRICIALINAFFKTFGSDAGNSEEVGLLMLERRFVPNYLSVAVNKIPTSAFQLLEDKSEFPSLVQDNFIRIALGTYQLKQARSYLQLHYNKNDGNFPVFVCNEEACKRYCEKLGTPQSILKLVLINMKSRYVSAKVHATYVLFDLNKAGVNSIIGYTCSCLTGLRTIGCCSHTLTLIYYLCNKDVDKVKLPSACMDNFFGIDLNSDVDSDVSE